MHVNYRYLLDRCEAETRDRTKMILDYGCGNGAIVEGGRDRGLRIYGVEEFYGGSNIRGELEKKGLLGDIVKSLEEGVIPFPDAHFDLVVSNQVFEHVVDLDEVLSEISRVLKPGGKLICVFPSKEVWREGHCGVPWAHWLPEEFRLRYY
jgi:SAM-dependent methyltransferase